MRARWGGPPAPADSCGSCAGNAGAEGGKVKPSFAKAATLGDATGLGTMEVSNRDESAARERRLKSRPVQKPLSDLGHLKSRTGRLSITSCAGCRPETSHGHALVVSGESSGRKILHPETDLTLVRPGVAKKVTLWLVFFFPSSSPPLGTGCPSTPGKST
jgi:hypothetical protein